MSSKPKPNIEVKDIGTLYTTDGKDIWLLIDFKPEPQVKMETISNILEGVNPIKEGSLSEFKNFIRLLPETEPVKLRKTRIDKGTHKPKVEQVSAPSAEAIPEPKKRRQKTTTPLKLIISTPHPNDKNGLIKVSIGEFACAGKTLRETIDLCLANFSRKIPDNMSDEDKKTLQGILEEV